MGSTRNAWWLRACLLACMASACGGSTPQRDVDEAGQSDAGVDLADGEIVELEHDCTDHVLRIALLDDGTLRLHFVSNGTPHAERGYTHTLDEFKGPNTARVVKEDGDLSVRTKELALQLRSGSCTPTVTDLDGRSVWSTKRGLTAKGESVSISRALARDERIFGLGERAGKADRRGRVLTNWTSDPVWNPESNRYTPKSDPLYQAHPFFLSVLEGKVNGTYLANTHKTVFDVGHGADDELAMKAFGGDIDLFVIHGPSPARVLERYTQLVGRAPLPPRWTLGYHQSRWSYTPAQRVQEIAAELRARELPADGLWLDIDAMDGYRTFTWDPGDFADPRALSASLAELGFKLTSIHDPGLKNDRTGNYAALERGLLRDAFIKDEDDQPITQICWPGAALFPDFSRADTRDWWGQELARFQAESGVLGSWIDMNEPDVFSADGFPSAARMDGDGQATTMAELRNVYGSLMAKASYEGALAGEPDVRPFVLTRAGFAGVHKYAAVWTGDNESEWETLAMLPAQLQGMSLSAIPFVGSDVGGFNSGAKTPEMYVRWFELGAFSPFFRSHVMRGAPDQEPWSFGPEVEAAAHKLLTLRYALYPYWYQTFVEANERGIPPMRPLWWDDPADEESFAHEDHFLIGPSLLVALVTAPDVSTRKVYLPKGIWIAFASGEAISGPAEHKIDVPWGNVPLFVRNGSIIPTQSARQYSDEPGDDTLLLELFVGPAQASGDLALYEDDGHTMQYRKGTSSRTQLELSASKARVALQIMSREGKYRPPARMISIRLHAGSNKPRSATLDSKEVALTWDDESQVASIRFEDDGEAHAIAFERVHSAGSDIVGFAASVCAP